MIPAIFDPEHLSDIRHAAEEVLRQEVLFEAFDYGEGLIVYQYHDALQDFHALCRELDFFPEFDWLSETPLADRLLSHPEEVANLDLDNLRKAICIHYKNEAFYPGHLAHLLEEGHYQKLLKHLVDFN